MTQFFILFDFIKEPVDLQIDILNCLQRVEYVYNYVSKVDQTRAEYSFTWCKILHRHIKLYILIEISKWSSEKYVYTARKTIFPRSWNIIESSKRPCKYHLSINFLTQKRPHFPSPKSSKQGIFFNQ